MPHRHLASRPRARDDGFVFLREWLANPLRTASVAPSSQALARAMVEAAAPPSGQPVIELGPGTGPVTQALLRHGVAEADIVMIESNPVFSARLRTQFPRATVVTGDARRAGALVARLGLPAAGAVVSSLPLLQWPVARRLALVASALRRCAPGARFAQFSYGPASPVPVGRAGVVCRERRQIWLNTPPAGVWAYELGRPEATRSRALSRVRERAALASADAGEGGASTP